jgi:predicted heme/steroid binding protein
MDNKLRYFTQKELKELDGKAGGPAYVAFEGKIYDVSKSRLWVDGDHTGRHFAGFDLASVKVNAPHSEGKIFIAWAFATFSDSFEGGISHLPLHQYKTISRIIWLHCVFGTP